MLYPYSLLDIVGKRSLTLQAPRRHVRQNEVLRCRVKDNDGNTRNNCRREINRHRVCNKEGTVFEQIHTVCKVGIVTQINHGNGVETYYGHCSKLYVKAGKQVKQGDVIAAVGNTGNSTGPHLHLEVRVNGVAYNPQNYLY